MTQCYVCLEACETTSPCECKMIVHKKCLVKAYQHMPRDDCSICRSPIQVEYIDLKPEPPTIHVRDIDENRPAYCATILYMFMSYLLFGWVGKMLLLAFGMALHDDLFPFWTAEHVLCFLGVFAVVLCIAKVIVILIGIKNNWNQN